MLASCVEQGKSAQEHAVKRFVLTHDHFGREARLNSTPAMGAVECANAPYRLDHRVDVVADESGYPVIDHFGNAAALQCDDRGAAGERFGHHDPEWFFPFDWHEQASSAAEQLVLAHVVHGAD